MAKREPLRLHPHPRPVFPWIIWLLSSLFQVYRQMLIVAPIVMIPELEKNLKISQADIGIVISMAIVPLFLFQIPFGILIDKYGPRRITSAAIFTTALGSLIFALSYNTLSASFGRVLIGIGGAASFVNVVKIISNWFKPKHFATILGATLSLGMIGMLFGELLVTHHIKAVGWQTAMIHYTIIGVILSIFYFILVKDKDPAIRYDMNPKARDFDFSQSLKKLLKSKQTWIITAYATFSEAPLPIFIGLWAIPFLTTFHHFSLFEASFINDFHLISGAIFAPLFGCLSTKIKRRKIFLQLGTLIAAVIVILILYPLSESRFFWISNFFIMGIGGAAIMLCYSLMHERAIPQLTATSIAIVNTFFAFFGIAGDQLVALVLDHHSATSFSHHLRFYSAETLQSSLIRIPIWLAIAFIISFFIKDSKARQKYFER